MARQRTRTARRGVPSPAPPAGPAGTAWIATALLVTSVVVVVAIRVRLLGMPLERDEGEYAYMGQLMLQGVPPYAAAYNMKFPGSYAAYAAAMALFGQTPAGIHLGLLLVNLATTGLLYLLARRLFSPYAAAVAAASHAVLSAGTATLGLAAHANHFVVVFAVGGLLVLVGAAGSARALPCFWAGLLLGLAGLMKQPGALLTLFGGLYALWTSPRGGTPGVGTGLRRAGLYVLGAALPLGAVCATLGAAGVLDRFWFWTIRYGAEYATRVSLAEGLARLAEQLPLAVGPQAGLWALAGLGLLAVVAARELRPRAGLVIGWTVFSAAAVSVGLYFRFQYFLLLLPALALAVGVAAGHARERLAGLGWPRAGEAAVTAIVVAALAWPLVADRRVYFLADPAGATRALYGPNPFVESVEIGRYLREHTAPDERVAVIGSEPQIYFYAGRRAATGHIYTYALMEPQPWALAMQREMIAEIEAARPRYLVSTNLPLSWFTTPDSHRLILTWAGSYAEAHYEVVGVAELRPEGPVQVRWEQALAGWQPTARYRIVVLRRRDA